ncbi:uncharacterized protein CCR75_008066 [Bremia lactucae]|uniref:Uncharacterized protein n=1 Tax=Bremia lactucae TaxID=4779 RepID=A0A976IB91_BRELC|nr:hypothetical protein CCR75_008066 [Bremia lactucae]
MFQVNAGAISSLDVAVDLVYTVGASCRFIATLSNSSDVLATRLFPVNTTFQRKVQLSKASSGDGCALHISVKGVVLASFLKPTDVFDEVKKIDQQLKQLLRFNRIENVALVRAEVALAGDRLLATSLTSENATPMRKSMLTVQQGVCADVLNVLKSEEGVKILPREVETSALDVLIRADADKTANCAVELEVVAMVPWSGSEAKILELLQAVEENMEIVFAGLSNATLVSVNVQLHVASKLPNVALATLSESRATLTFNPPSYEESLGIFALVAVLLVMMMAVVVQKKRNDQHCHDRFERANHAAQIRRVSIRMSPDHEKQHYEGEEDSLL